MTASKPDWKNRIVERGDADPATLVANELNWRVHGPEQTQAMRDVLDRVGWVQSVIVNRKTGRLVDGHLRVQLAVDAGEFGGVCLSPDCASYDPERDADRFFAGGDRHRELRRKEER